MAEEKKIIRVSVRSLVEFLLRSGSLEPGGGLAAEAAMLEGARIHRALQKKEGPDYRAEVPLSIDLPVRGSGTGGESDTLSPQGVSPKTAPGEPVNTEPVNTDTAPAETVTTETAPAETVPGETVTTETAPVETSSYTAADLKASVSTVSSLKAVRQKEEGLAERYLLRIEGRADGIYFSKEPALLQAEKSRLQSGSSVSGTQNAQKDFLPGGEHFSDEGLWTIDEIKTVFRGFGGLKEAVPVHLAQARCYAYIYAGKEGLERIGVRMTYCSQTTGEVKRFYEYWEYTELSGWFDELIGDYMPWVRMRIDFGIARTGTLREMVFPFPYRDGQYRLAAGVYRTIVRGKKLFLQAPTGTGKTMAVLFPSLKAVGEGKAERIFYLTAKAVAGRAAIEALTLLNRNGLSLRSIVLTSKERICPCENVDCHPSRCPRAEGHYDRVNEALEEMLRAAAGGAPMTAAVISGYAEKHRVCPYELALDASDYADVVVCDYNYVFHPEARLTRFFGDPGRRSAAAGTIFLIDEAHNLLERGREMYSASLSYRDVRRFRKSIKSEWPRLWKKLKGLVHVLRLLDSECFPKAEQQGTADNEADAWAQYAAATGPRAVSSVASRLTGENMKLCVLSDWTEDAGVEQDGQPENTVISEAPRKEAAEIDFKQNNTIEKDSASVVPQRRKSENIRRQELLYSLREVSDTIHWILEQERRSEALYETIEDPSARGSSGETGLTELLEFYFEISHFLQMLEEMDGHYITYCTKSFRGSPGGGFTLHLYCADPSGKLRDYMAGSVSSILFSATFLPIQYYKGLLGGTSEDFEMYARSSFSPERRKVVIVNDVTSRYRSRNAGNYEKIAGSIARTVSCRPGNYLAFFPSYAFLDGVREAFCRICGIPQDLPQEVLEEGSGRAERQMSGEEQPEKNGKVYRQTPGEVQQQMPGELRPESIGRVHQEKSGEEHEIVLITQKRKMDESEREAFLGAFEEIRTDRFLVGFCVMGGMFGEGIDLRNDRLIGTFIVGTGIPPVDSRRELLREYFSRNGRNGYDFAYRFPGMNKVLQAAGRVIRTEEDLGVILLLDGRFENAENRGLFPIEWGTPAAADSSGAAELIREFWREHLDG